VKRHRQYAILPAVLVVGLALTLGGCELLGIGGAAVSFTESGAGYGELPYAASLSYGSAVTVEAWVKLTSYVGWASFVTKGGTAGGEYSLRQDDVGTGHLRFTINDSDAGTLETVDSAGVLSLNTWHHVAGTYDGATMAVYIDGKLDGSLATTTAVVTTTEPLYIGVDFPGATEYFDGALSEVRVWNVARSAADIKANMDTRLVGTEPGLVALCHLTDGIGNQFKESVRGVNGTLSGQYAWAPGPAALP
jgi:hypothetical protein